MLSQVHETPRYYVEPEILQMLSLSQYYDNARVIRVENLLTWVKLSETIMDS